MPWSAPGTDLVERHYCSDGCVGKAVQAWLGEVKAASDEARSSEVEMVTGEKESGGEAAESERDDNTQENLH